MGVCKHKKILLSALFLFFAGLFFVANIHTIFAQAIDPSTATSAIDAAKNVGGIGEWLLWAFNVLLLAIFNVMAWLVTYAAAAMQYALDPAAVKALFSMDAVYTLWQMVRDFFNLFFILTLLFIAFATIFQISKYNYKMLLKMLLLMALLVNFSWPITRFIIDATNVPMYFFLSSMFTNSSQAAGGNIASVAFSSSSMANTILPKKSTTNNQPVSFSDLTGNTTLTVKLIQATVFMFLFGMSLLVLSVLFIIRTVALIILLIFSSAGFAGLAIPGFQKYASDWWNKLMQYALFGPSAALMLLIAVRFMQEFNVKATPGISSAVGNGDSMMVTGVTMIIPLILIWMAMTVSGSASIVGSGMVVGQATKWSKTVGRKAAKWGGYGALQVGTLGQADRFAAYGKGAYAGMKDVPKTGQLFGKNIGGEKGAKIIKWMGRSEERTQLSEAKAKGVVKKGWEKGRESAQEEFHNKRMHARSEELKKENIGDSQLHQKVAGPDKVEAGAAAMLLSERKAAMTTDQFTAALDALGKNTKEASALIGNTNFEKLDEATYAKIRGSDAFKDANTGANLRSALDQKLAKSGSLKLSADYNAKEAAEDLVKKGKSVADAEAEAFEKAYKDAFGHMSAQEIAKQSSATFESPHFKKIIEGRTIGAIQQIITEAGKAANSAAEDAAQAVLDDKRSTLPSTPSSTPHDPNAVAAARAANRSPWTPKNKP